MLPVQGPHCTGKTRKMGRNESPVRENRELRNFAKIQGILYAQVDSTDIGYIFAVKFHIFQVCFAYKIVANSSNWPKGNFQLDRENIGNLEIGKARRVSTLFGCMQFP